MIRILLAVFAAALLVACAENPSMDTSRARTADIDKQLGPFDSSTRDQKFPADANRPVRNENCTQPVPIEGANLKCD
jgi:hypothetical protein